MPYSQPTPGTFWTERFNGREVKITASRPGFVSTVHDSGSGAKHRTFGLAEFYRGFSPVETDFDSEVTVPKDRSSSNPRDYTNEELFGREVKPETRAALLEIPAVGIWTRIEGAN